MDFTFVPQRHSRGLVTSPSKQNWARLNRMLRIRIFMFSNRQRSSYPRSSLQSGDEKHEINHFRSLEAPWITPRSKIEQDWIEHWGFEFSGFQSALERHCFHKNASNWLFFAGISTCFNSWLANNLSFTVCVLTSLSLNCLGNDF